MSCLISSRPVTAWSVIVLLLLLVTGSWCQNAYAAETKRLLSKSYPDLFDAITAGRAVQKQFTRLAVIHDPDTGGYRLVLAESQDQASIAAARRAARRAGFGALRVVTLEDSVSPGIPIENARVQEFNSLARARREVETALRRGEIVDAAPVRRMQPLTSVQLVGYASRADADKVTRALEVAGIKTLIRSPRPTQEYFIGAGAYREERNVRKQIRRLSELGFANISIVRLDKSLTGIRLIGYSRGVDARQDARVLEKAGIETVVASSVQRGFSVSTGAFRKQDNVYHQIRRLTTLGYSNIRAVPLGARAERYRVVSLAHGQDNGRVILVANSEHDANDNVLMFGSSQEPMPQVGDTQSSPGNVRLVVDPLWVEAGVLPDETAQADGSHYLHSKLTAEWLSHENWEVRLGARVDSYIQTGELDFDHTEADYDESYLRYRTTDRTLTLGAQTVLWGRVDELPPTDRLSVQDVSRFVLDDLEDRRRAVPGLRWEEFAAGHKFDLLYVPRFRAAELPREESIWSPVDRSRGRIIGMPPSPLVEPLVREGRFVEDDEGSGGWGLRLSRTGHQLDYALTIQDARHSLPYYELNPVVRQALQANPGDIAGALAAAPETFIARHPRTWVLGGDLAFAAGRSTWRFEAAWLSDHPATTTDLRYTTVEAADWVAGVELFPGDGNLRMTVQLRGLHLLNAEEELLDREDIYTLFGDVENSFQRQRWRARLRYSVGLDAYDVYLNPELAFEGWEPHELYLGYHYFDGEENTPGGFHQQHDLFTLGWRARF